MPTSACERLPKDGLLDGLEEVLEDTPALLSPPSDARTFSARAFARAEAFAHMTAQSSHPAMMTKVHPNDIANKVFLMIRPTLMNQQAPMNQQASTIRPTT